MAALDALLKRLDISTAPRQTDDAVVIHQSSGPTIMSINQSFRTINDTLDRINVTLVSISEMSKQCLEMTKELLRIVKSPGFMEAFNAKKQARIEAVTVSNSKHN
jgi:hypothetical protein